MNSKTSYGWYRWLFIIMAVLYIIAGISLIANPVYFAPFMISMFGWLAIVYGVMMIATYFLSVNFKNIWTLLFGIALVVIGLIVLCNLWEAGKFLGAFAGVCFLLAGVFKAYQSFVLKDMGLGNWWLILILGICNLIVGIILICNLNAAAALLTLLIGTNLLVNGASDLMLGFMAF